MCLLLSSILVLCLALPLNAEDSSGPCAGTECSALSTKAMSLMQQRMVRKKKKDARRNGIETHLIEEVENASRSDGGNGVAAETENMQTQSTKQQFSRTVDANLDGSVARANPFQTLPTFAVLLTTYNTEDRQPMYMMRLQWWLRETKLPLFVVDSAGRGFPQNLSKIRSFKQLKFNQTDVLGDSPGSTLGELLSMQRAWELFQGDWSRFDYVVKVTGKYVFPDLQTEMKKVHIGNSFIIERYSDAPLWQKWVNTEYLGFNATRMGDLLDKLANNEGCMEVKLGQVLMTHQYPSQQLGSMIVPKQYRTKRGAGDILKVVLLGTSEKAKGHAAPQALK